MPRFRPRISLLTAILLMTIVGMAIVVARQWRELRPLRDEVRRLRNEVGELSIDDPSKVHAIQVRQVGEFHWKWRCWVPPGADYALVFQVNQISAKGFPTNVGRVPLRETGEVWIDYKIEPVAGTNKWGDSLTTLKVAQESNSEELEWMNWSRIPMMCETVGYETKTKENGERILLARLRTSKTAPNGRSIEDPAAGGFMIWIEPTK